MGPITESDWRLLSKLKPLALDRLCRRILDGIDTISADTTITVHERYIGVSRFIAEHDKIVGHCFNGLSRSNAPSKLNAMVEERLITEEEAMEFSEEVRSRIYSSRG